MIIELIECPQPSGTNMYKIMVDGRTAECVSDQKKAEGVYDKYVSFYEKPPEPKVLKSVLITPNSWQKEIINTGSSNGDKNNEPQPEPASQPIMEEKGWTASDANVINVTHPTDESALLENISNTNTTGCWLDLIEDELIRKAALANASRLNVLSKPAIDILDALVSMIWEETEEGGLFWSDIFTRYRNGELKLKRRQEKVESIGIATEPFSTSEEPLLTELSERPTTVMGWIDLVEDDELRNKMREAYEIKYIRPVYIAELDSAIGCLCEWESSKEGSIFWHHQQNLAVKGEIKLKPYKTSPTDEKEKEA